MMENFVLLKKDQVEFFDENGKKVNKKVLEAIF